MNFSVNDIKIRLEELRLARDEAEEVTATDADIQLADEMAEARDSTSLSRAAGNRGLVLADIPISEWSRIPVSPISLFGDNVWDFSCFPSASKKSRIYFDYINHHNFNLVNASKHWLLIMKALVLYRLPRYSFSGRNRAYGDALMAHRSKFLQLIKFFQECGLYLGDSPNGTPTLTLNDVSIGTVSEYLLRRPTPAQRWEFAAALQYWQNLSRSGMLPPIYAISEQFVADEVASRLRREMDDFAAPFEPIPLDDYAQLVGYAAAMVNDYSEDLLWLARTYYPTLTGKDVSRAPSIANGLSLAEPDGVEAFMRYQPRLVHGEPWWDLRVLERSHPRDSGEYLSYARVSSYVQGLFDCCITIIFATTGMRRSEVARLKADCTETDADGHWLTFVVFKTSEASQGDRKKIPIPQVTFNAVAVLRSLCASSREFGRHDYLLSCINRAHFGKHPHSTFAERALMRVADACGVEGNIHAHRFRKSLAMYIIYQDSRNIELIRQLFSHKSLRMTLRYILSLPGVNEELKRYLVEKNTEILADVMAAATSGRIGGKGGMRVKDSLADSRTFLSRLQDRGKETLEQYVDSLLDSGVKLLHRSNLAICIRSPSVNDTVPCVGKAETASSRLQANLFACDPFNCNYAVFTEAEVEAISNEVLFHERMLTHPYCGKDQADYSVRRIREANRRLAEIAGTSDSAENTQKYG